MKINKNKGGNTLEESIQYTLIIRRPDETVFFNNAGYEHKVFEIISELIEPLKVDKILKIDGEGNVEEQDIVFKNGRFELITKIFK